MDGLQKTSAITQKKSAEEKERDKLWARIGIEARGAKKHIAPRRYVFVLFIHRIVRTFGRRRICSIALIA